ncbi:MAG: CBO2463/CBO2479 domain-containing protein [Lachnospiraceae bacterium]
MKAMDYIINPVLMGGLVKEVKGDFVKVHLHGRLGVITVPRALVLEEMQLKPGHEMQFYFSYLQVNEAPYDYDSSSICCDRVLEPCLVGGIITEVNDTAIKADIMNELGTVAVPRRFVFTDVPLKEGQNIEFYFSPMHVIGKREIPAESI